MKKTISYLSSVGSITLEFLEIFYSGIISKHSIIKKWKISISIFIAVNILLELT